VVEAVVEGESGYLVNGEDPDEIAEKVLLLLNDDALARSLGMRGLEIARRNNTKEVTKQFLVIAERILRHR